MSEHTHTYERCAEWNFSVPGWWYGSNWHWVPCQEPGHHAPTADPDPSQITIELVPR